jgi:hypothetical protein
MTKYLNTRDGSIEDAAVKTVEQNITFEKKEIKLEEPKNRYLDTRDTSLEAAVTKVVTENTMWEDSAKEQAEIKEKAKYMKAEMGDYQAKFKKELEKTGKSISQMSDDEKKKFFDKMDSKHKADNEAVDPETLTNLRNKISDTTAKVSKVDRTEPAGKAKADIMQSQLKTDKLKLQDLMKKQAADNTKKEGYEGKTYKSYKHMKKEAQTAKNMKMTMTKKPVTPIEVDPTVTEKDKK